MGRSGPRKPKTREKEKEARVANVVASKPKSGALEKPSVAQLVAQRARIRRAPKPYLRVPDLPDPPPPNVDGSETPSEPSEQPQPLPKAETIYRNHLYNQSLVSGW